MGLVRWHKQWAGREKFYAFLNESGRLARAHRRPDATAHWWLYRAFNELATCRSVGMSVGPIPLSVMWMYVDRYALPEWVIDALMRIDRAWLEIMHDE